MLDDGDVSSGFDNNRYVAFPSFFYLLAQYPEPCMSARTASRCAIIW
jgi:hypothetical protein